MRSARDCSGDQLVVMRWVGRVERLGGERRNACRVLVGKPEGNRAFVEDRHRWRIILKWSAWAGLFSFSIGTSRGLL
jgi:hypothetical protein